ncbi:MAG TPA: UdgX family uracil-DNA binding protein [Rudaea sp.]
MARAPSIATLRARARGCRDCDLWKHATQTVFGEGPDDAQIVFLGEQPGDAEDRSGHPFVGPSGMLLDRALDDAGVDHGKVYVTNVVKHFKFTPRGKRRMHQRANAQEQAACRHWLESELARIRPQRIVCLGATAAKAMLGPSFGLMRERGRWRDHESGARIMATVHPSYILRVHDEDREKAYAQFVADLKTIAKDEIGKSSRK